MRQATPFVLVAVLLSACQSSEPTTDRGTASTGWRSTDKAMQHAGLALGFTGSGSATVDADGVDAMLLGTADCPDGGTVTFDAEGSVHPDTVVADLTIEFDGCAADGVVIDGSMTYFASVEPDLVEASVEGQLEWSGEIEGSCAVDLKASVSKTGASASAHVGGSMCGWDLTDLQ